MDVKLGETVFFDIVTHNVSGNVENAVVTPRFQVFEEDSDSPLVDTTFTKRANTKGTYRGTFVAGTGNGFEVGKYYDVISSGTVGNVSARDVTLTFYVDDRKLSDFDIYHAEIAFNRDTSSNEYTITWFKNANRLLTGSVTNATLQVVKRSDGTNLIPPTGLTEIGSTGSFKADVGGGFLQTDGEVYLVLTSGNIDSALRDFSWLLGRDV